MIFFSSIRLEGGISFFYSTTSIQLDMRGSALASYGFLNNYPNTLVYRLDIIGFFLKLSLYEFLTLDGIPFIVDDS